MFVWVLECGDQNHPSSFFVHCIIYTLLVGHFPPPLLSICSPSFIPLPPLPPAVPPYIPSVGAPDDTSNFDSFEKKKDDGIPLQPTPGFSAKSLPFVGFTFARYSPTSVALVDQ